MKLKYQALSYDQLKRKFDLKDFTCETTEAVPEIRGMFGQDRAIKAIEFGLNIDSPGYNVYVAGISDTGRTSTVERILRELAAKKEAPSDWCYVHNFQDPDQPRSIVLPSGKGRIWQKEMKDLLISLKTEIPKAFETKDYKEKSSKISENYEKQKRQLFSDIEKKAQKKGFQIKRIPEGFAPIPLKNNGQPLSEEEFHKLNLKERKRIEENIKTVQKNMKETFEQFNLLDRKSKEELTKFNKDMALSLVGYRIDILKGNYRNYPDVLHHLDEVKADLVDSINDFLRSKEEPSFLGIKIPVQDSFIRYEINVVVDNSHTKGAPVIMETNPTYGNMFGRIEKKAQLGALITDFTKIKAGSVLKANGGYLVVDAEGILRNPFVWDTLKRNLRNKEIKIEEAAEQYAFLSTSALRPMPIPLNIKVVMIGKGEIFDLLHAYDDNFKKIFKIRADFDYETAIDDNAVIQCARFICKICNDEKLRHCHRTGIAAIMEYGSRLAADQNKLSLQFGKIANLLREANFWAKADKSSHVSRKHVEKALEEKEYRSSLLENKIQEMIERGTIYIDTEGEKVGQINALSVYTYGEFSFGKPSRITVQTFMGNKGVINIEREAKLSGKTHDKGVLILSGYLGGKYGGRIPLSLSATLTFEQSYSFVEGDSASSTELFALLSSLSGLPIKQSIAVTGSVNQHGEIQPIGGANQKIEGFFDVCQAKGITGKQGVIIPKSNVRNLTLKNKVIDAVKKGKFHIYPISTIDEGMEILTGVEAGKRGKDGSFAENTVNDKVQNKLIYFMKEQTKLRKESETEVKDEKSS
jgi:lon-related putative ATP-dependent protease